MWVPGSMLSVTEPNKGPACSVHGFEEIDAKSLWYSKQAEIHISSLLVCLSGITGRTGFRITA